MSQFDVARGGSVEGVEYLSVTAPHAREVEPGNRPHPPHGTIDVNAELDEIMHSRLSDYMRRRNERATLREQQKQARNAGLKTRHATKLRRTTT